VSHQKGHDVLVEAWPSVTARVPGARAVVVGGGELLAGLSAAAPAGLAFVGERTDARDFVAAADVVALPSRWEGLSLAMLEALATGRAVVSADVAGSEVVSRSGGGAVVPVEDPAALGRALVDRLSGDVDADEEGRAGAAYVQEHHGLEVCQQQAAAVILRAHAFGTSRPG
jgi:glycosyltransferase involved in cell wall biosynthesis